MAKKRTRPTRGALIKGMTRKPLPSGTLRSPQFEKALEKVMKGHPGIYALYRGDNLYYVGLTRDLHGRIRGHLKDKHAGKWDRFYIFKIGKVKYLKDLETLIVNVAKPKANLQKGHVPKRGIDLTSSLRDEVRRAKKEVSELEKYFH